MKIIEALKQIKHLDRKIKKTSERIVKWSSYLVNSTYSEADNTPQYSAQDLKIMHQQIGDWVLKKAELRNSIHRTNIETKVQYKGKEFTIDELIILRTEVLPVLKNVEQLYSRKDVPYGAKDTKVIVQYDFKERDKRIDSIENDQEELGNFLDKLTLETDII